MKISVNDAKNLKDIDGMVLAYWQAEDAARRPELPLWASGSIDTAEFSGAIGQMVMLRSPASHRIDASASTSSSAPPARCVLLLGLGMPAKTNSHAYVNAYAQGFGVLKNARCKTIALQISEWPGAQNAGNHAQLSFPHLVGRIASQVMMADYAFDKYKQVDKNSPKASVDEVVLMVPAAHAAAAHASVSRGVKIGEAANLTRMMQNEPGNVATPSWIAAQAAQTARAAKNGRLSMRVIGKSELARLKMNAMLAVAGGSSQEPKLVIMQYRGAPGRKEWDTAIVGKGVTFDSGGISIKPSSKMDEMKFDKSGACAVIGILSGCASLGLPLNVVGVAALVENMPGGHAYRPGDIVTACNGTTIEVLNTDAEGRLVLADALAYAAKHYSPNTMIDLATLTGACAVALGDLASGILSDDDEMVDELVAAGERSGERVWRLPMWPEYDEKVKSEIAVVKNMGEPGNAGVTAGASFLKPFAGEGRWAHIDIAGTAYGSKPRGGMSAGGYGTGVRLVLEYLSQYKTSKKNRN